MSKYILIDLEDTITIHKYNNRLKSVMLKWLEFNNVSNPLGIYNNNDFKNRNTRLKLLGITEKEYEKWYKNFSEVEFIEYYKKYNFILREYNLTEKFKYIFNRDYSLDDIKKPNPKVVDIIEKHINDKISHDSIVIGDSYIDYIFAQNCNFKFISMYNSFNNCKSCKSFKELLNIINNYN